MSHRVLLLIKGLGRGGAEQLLVNSATHTDRSRFEYEVAYVLPAKSALAPELRDMGIAVHCLGRNRDWPLALRRLAARNRISLIHAHSPTVAATTRLLFPRRSSMRLVYTEHGPWHHYRARTYTPNLCTYWRNDHVFAVSDHVHQSIRYPAPFEGLRMPTVETLYHGLDMTALGSSPAADGIRRELGIDAEAPLIGTIANFRPQKGHFLLLEAARLVRLRIPSMRLLLVGKGPLEDAVKRRAAEMGLGDAVVFAGFRSDIPRILASIDVFALSSGWEGLSIALLEAMACGLPAVATRAGGVSEVIEDGRSGLLVPLDDPRTMSDAIIRVIEDAPLAAKLGAEARLRARRFDIKETVRREEAVYAELLS